VVGAGAGGHHGLEWGEVDGGDGVEGAVEVVAGYG
jgi:hypothetical protein